MALSSSADRADSTTAHVWIEIDGKKVPFLLAKDENGNFEWHPGWAPMLSPSVRQDEFNYQHLPPEIDIAIPFDDWHLGAGQFDTALDRGTDIEHQEGVGSHAYHYSRGLDASWPQRVYLSPKRNSVTFDGDQNGAPAFFSDTSLGHFMASGRYLYKFDVTAKNYTEVADLGAGNAWTGPVVEFNGVLFAPAGDTVAYRFSSDGTTWTASTLADPYAFQFTVRGYSSNTPQLWKMTSNGTLKSNTSGTNAGAVAWSSAIPTGHTSESAKTLLTANDLIWVFKKEGFYTCDGTNVDDVFKTQYLSTTNGTYAHLANDGFIYVPYGDRLMKLSPYDNTYEFVFPRFASPEVSGEIHGITSDVDFIYLTIKNTAGNTYIIKGYDREWHTIVFPFGSLSQEATPNTAASDSTIGDVAWANPSNIIAAEENATAGEGTSEYLLATNFGFNIPTNATVTGIEAAVARTGGGASAWTVIDSETLAAPASSISFTGISSTYRMFRVTAYIVKDGTSGQVFLRFNNDSGANYDHQRLTGNGSSVVAARVTGDSEIDATVTVGASQTATLSFVIGKQVSNAAAMVTGAVTFGDATPILDIDRRAGRWNNTADLISQIDLIASSGNFAAGTTVVLEAM